MAAATGRRFEREQVLDTFLAHCRSRYEALEAGDAARIQEAYRARMYRLGERHPYRLPDGTLFHAAIEGVRPSGELLLRRDDGTTGAYLFKEVEFIIGR